MSTGDYSEAPSKAEQEGLHNFGGGFQDPTQPLALPVTATESARPPVASDSVEGLTIAEAASAFGLSVSTVRRLLKAGKLIGAAKVPSPKGLEYRLPPSAFESLGYQAKASQSGAVLTAARASLEAEQLATKVKELEAILQLEKLKRELAEERERLKDQQIEDLRNFSESLRTALEKLPAALEAPKRRGLFRKK